MSGVLHWGHKVTQELEQAPDSRPERGPARAAPARNPQAAPAVTPVRVPGIPPARSL